MLAASAAYGAGQAASVHKSRPCIMLSADLSFDPVRATAADRAQWPPFPTLPNYLSNNALALPLSRMPDLCAAAWVGAANVSGIAGAAWDDSVVWAAAAGLCAHTGPAAAPYDHLLLIEAQAAEVRCDMAAVPLAALTALAERVQRWEASVDVHHVRAAEEIRRRLRATVLRRRPRLHDDARRGLLLADYVVSPFIVWALEKSSLHQPLGDADWRSIGVRALTVLPPALRERLRDLDTPYYPTHEEEATIAAAVSVVLT